MPMLSDYTSLFVPPITVFPPSSSLPLSSSSSSSSSLSSSPSFSCSSNPASLFVPQQIGNYELNASSQSSIPSSSPSSYLSLASSLCSSFSMCSSSSSCFTSSSSLTYQIPIASGSSSSSASSFPPASSPCVPSVLTPNTTIPPSSSLPPLSSPLSFAPPWPSTYPDKSSNFHPLPLSSPPLPSGLSPSPGLPSSPSLFQIQAQPNLRPQSCHSPPFPPSPPPPPQFPAVSLPPSHFSPSSSSCSSSSSSPSSSFSSSSSSSSSSSLSSSSSSSSHIPHPPSSPCYASVIGDPCEALDTYLRLLSSAQSNIYISTWVMTDNPVAHKIISILADRIRHGVAVTVVSFGGFVPRLSHCLTTIVPLVGGRPIRLKKMEPREWMKKIREIRLTGLNGTHEKITCIDEQICIFSDRNFEPAYYGPQWEFTGVDVVVCDRQLSACVAEHVRSGLRERAQVLLADEETQREWGAENSRAWREEKEEEREEKNGDRDEIDEVREKREEKSSNGRKENGRSENKGHSKQVETQRAEGENGRQRDETETREEPEQRRYEKATQQNGHCEQRYNGHENGHTNGNRQQESSTHTSTSFSSSFSPSSSSSSSSYSSSLSPHSSSSSSSSSAPLLVSEFATKVPFFRSHSDHVTAAYIAAIQNADEILLVNFVFFPSSVLWAAIRHACTHRQLRVTVVINDAKKLYLKPWRKAARSYMLSLPQTAQNYWLGYRGRGTLHNKFMLTDKELVFGSFNLDFYSDCLNAEYIIRSQNPELMQAMYKYYCDYLLPFCRPMQSPKPNSGCDRVYPNMCWIASKACPCCF